MQISRPRLPSPYHINIPGMSWQLYLCKFPNQIRKIFHLSAAFFLANFLFNFFVLCSLWFGFLFFYLWQLIWWSGRGHSYTNQFHYIEAKINWNKEEGFFSSSRQTVGDLNLNISAWAGQLYLKDSSAPLHTNSPRFTPTENKFICSCRSFFKCRPTACNSIKMSSGVNFIENV